jgi:hypothetical protein
MKIVFVAESKDGLWFVTSPNSPGLLAAHSTLPGALTEAGASLQDMAFAVVLAMAEGGVPKGVFVGLEQS